jgi:hypothetical protein
VVALSGNRIAWQYHADDGVTYRVAAQKALTDQGKLGGEAWDGLTKAKPGNIKMRRTTVSDGTYSRVVPVYSLDAPILGAGQTINVNAAGDARALTGGGPIIAEVHPPNPRVTKESA